MAIVEYCRERSSKMLGAIGGETRRRTCRGACLSRPVAGAKALWGVPGAVAHLASKSLSILPL